MIDNKTYKLLSANEVAQTLNISRSLVYQLVEQRKIPVVHINSAIRVRPEDLEIYIQQNLSSPFGVSKLGDITYVN